MRHLSRCISPYKFLPVALIFNFFIYATASGQSIQRVKIEALNQRIQESKGTLIITFFATWCKPCVAELPYFHELWRQYRKNNVQMLMVSLDFEKDFPAAIESFVKKNGYDSKIFWLDETDADKFCPVIDKSWSGVIPATLIVHNANGYRKFFEGEISKQILETSIRSSLALDSATHTPGLLNTDIRTAQHLIHRLP